MGILKSGRATSFIIPDEKLNYVIQKSKLFRTLKINYIDGVDGATARIHVEIA